MEGGRLRAEDCTTFRVLRDTFGFLPESTIFIFNKTSARFNEAAKRETIRIFSSEVGFPVHESKTIFFPNVGDEISMNLSRNLQNPRVTENRNYVLAAIDTSLFSQHRFREEEERLQEELKRVQEETRKNTVIQKLTVYRAKQNQITNELASLHGFLCEVANRHHNRIHADYGLRHKKRSEEIIAFRRSRSYEFNQRCSSDQLENQLLEWYRQSRRDRDELNEFTVGVTNSVNIHQDARNKADGQRLLAQWNVCLSRITEDDDSSRCVIC